ncbi:MAG: thioredoxin family protein [Prevotellaceae bacterium]|nr:thioredoxin family protein [Prevotellaceae bacterium]
MKKYLILLTSMMFSIGIWAQLQDPVHFEVRQKRISDAELKVVFSAKIDAGWHVYGTDIADGGPTKAELTIETQEGLEPKGTLKATGQVHRAMDDLFGVEVSYMEGNASFEQDFQITGQAYKVSGYLTYGACNDRSCLPPTDIEFSFTGEGAKQAAKENEKVAEAVVESPELQETECVADTVLEDSVAMDNSLVAKLWTPVIRELQTYDSLASGTKSSTASLLTVFLLGLLGGLAALVTPCVWPIIPMTVSFFLKRNKDFRGRGIRDAITYGLSIVVIYVALGLLVTLLFGASALNSMSTNAVFNIFFFLLLLAFGASFLGGFDIQLPSSWGNAVNRKAGSTSGLLSIFLMAFTLALVSFSCTGPIIGFLLVEVSTSGGIVAPTVGMLGFAIALALPFTLFALFPSWLKAVPKSGNWMNRIKVSLGFIELAFSLKFLSVADLAYGWHILDREVFLSLWIVLFALWGAYLIGWIRFPHDEDEYDEQGEVVVNRRTSVIRFFLSVLCFAFAIYMVPGLWGAPCKAISAFAPPLSTQDFKLGTQETKAAFRDYEEGMIYASENHKPVLLDFTGYGCVNCRKMEAAVWSDSKVSDIINGDYVLISLYVDDKTPLPEKEIVSENGQQRTLRTVGDKWSYLQRMKFGANAQPFYVLVDNEGRPLAKSYSYDENVSAYVHWLRQGLSNYNEK